MKPGLAAVGSATVAVPSQSSGITAMFSGHVVYNNCALYMLLYKQCRGFYRCSKRVVNARSVFQEHHLVIIILYNSTTKSCHMTDYVMSCDMYTYSCNFIPFCCVIEALENDQITLIDACSMYKTRYCYTLHGKLTGRTPTSRPR